MLFPMLFTHGKSCSFSYAFYPRKIMLFPMLFTHGKSCSFSALAFCNRMCYDSGVERQTFFTIAAAGWVLRNEKTMTKKAKKDDYNSLYTLNQFSIRDTKKILSDAGFVATKSTYIKWSVLKKHIATIATDESETEITDMVGKIICSAGFAVVEKTSSRSGRTSKLVDAVRAVKVGLLDKSVLDKEVEIPHTAGEKERVNNLFKRLLK